MTASVPGWSGRFPRDGEHSSAIPRTPLRPASLTLPTMCGRYASFLPAEALRRRFRAVNPLLNLEPSWNVAPHNCARGAPASRYRGAAS
jgi:hypothetical protein